MFVIWFLCSAHVRMSSINGIALLFTRNNIPDNILVSRIDGDVGGTFTLSIITSTFSSNCGAANWYYIINARFHRSISLIRSSRANTIRSDSALINIFCESEWRRYSAAHRRTFQMVAANTVRIHTIYSFVWIWNMDVGKRISHMSLESVIRCEPDRCGLFKQFTHTFSQTHKFVYENRLFLVYNNK